MFWPLPAFCKPSAAVSGLTRAHVHMHSQRPAALELSLSTPRTHILVGLALSNMQMVRCLRNSYSSPEVQFKGCPLPPRQRPWPPLTRCHLQAVLLAGKKMMRWICHWRVARSKSSGEWGVSPLTQTGSPGRVWRADN